MGQITIDNYEAYLLDLAEGTLSGEMQVELELFLIQHPELRADLSDLPLFAVNTDEVVFKAKNSLKRSENDLVTEEQFIAYIEQQLPLNERMQLEKSCAANPSLAKELSLYKKTIAAADASVVYEPKHELKRKPKVIWFNFSASRFAAAASVLFLIGLFVVWPKPGENNLSHTAGSLANNDTQTNTTILKNATQKPAAVKEVPLPPATVPAHSNTGNFNHEQKVAVNNNSVQSNTSAVQNNEVPVPNVVNPPLPAIANGPVNELLKEERNSVLLASNSKTTVEVITEADDEEVPGDPPKKKGIWGLAKRTLKNLHNAGVKAVNGAEEKTKDNTTYALTLGNIKITHKGN